MWTSPSWSTVDPLQLIATGLFQDSVDFALHDIYVVTGRYSQPGHPPDQHSSGFEGRIRL